METKPMSKKKAWIFNLLFILVSVGIVLFLLNAPPETTAKIPYDDNHKSFFSMGKKEAESHCEECHSQKGGMPLPKEHPPKYRCLFCHKKSEVRKK